MLEAIAKVLVFAKGVSNLLLTKAEFDSGVYRVDVSGRSIPERPFLENIVEEHVLCKDLVESVLRDFSVTRDDDLLLLLGVWKAQGVNINLNDVELSTMFNAESITRSRRKLQNDEGLFLPTTFTVAKRRRINEELLREHYGKVMNHENNY